MIVRIGSRGSKLALIQALMVDKLLKKNFSDIETQIIKISTMGDIIRDIPLNEIGEKGLFIKEIECALLNNKIDIAVHSMKDVPVTDCKEITIPCVLKRDNPYDAFISLNYKNIESLPEGSSIGTSSVRRKVQLLKIRPDLEIRPLRGNIDTRLKKLLYNDFDAIVLSTAGLERIDKFEMITQILKPEVMLSAVGQGAICVQCRNKDLNILNMLKTLNHLPSFLETSAERYFMKAVNGSCSTPLAALAKFIDANQLKMRCMLANEKKIEFLERIFSKQELKKASLNMGEELKMKLTS